MNAIAAHRLAAPQALVSMPARIAAAIAVAGAIALAFAGAEQASHEAVLSAGESFSRTTMTVTLPRVEIVARRDAANAAGTGRI